MGDTTIFSFYPIPSNHRAGIDYIDTFSTLEENDHWTELINVFIATAT